MDLFELLLNYASPALARMLLTKWIGNSDIAEELTGSLRDIISKFTNDRLAQRKAETLFTDIGNDIANSLLKVFNSEGMNIVSERKIVVVRAVIDTLPRV